MATAKKKATSVWPAAARRKLSAIRVSQASDPKDFTYDATTARAEVMRRAAGTAFEAVPEEPTALTIESERSRVNMFAKWIGTVDGLHVWGSGGRSFTDEGWNSLVGLWLGRGGWDLVFALITPDPANPMKNDLSNDKSAPWYALRRYLHAASAEEYTKLKSRFEPVFRALFEATKCAAVGSANYREQREGRDHLAFAFDRDSTWASEVVDDFLSSGLTGVMAQKRSPDLHLLLAVVPDVESIRRAFKQRGFPPSVTYHVFDLVETAGARAIPLLEEFKPNGAPDKKRVAAALAIAQKL